MAGEDEDEEEEGRKIRVDKPLFGFCPFGQIS